MMKGVASLFMLILALWASSDPYYSKAYLIPEEPHADDAESSHIHDDLVDHGKDDPSSVVVQTTNGPIRGFVQKLPAGESLDVFLGIPYAKPPVGDLRFRKPVPVEQEDKTFAAQNPPNSCQQELYATFPNFRGEEMWNPNTPISEDCLYLNLWVPSSIRETGGSGATVLVWIHGGGYSTGTSTLEQYDGSYLAGTNDVIVASMNYRLGPFGFLFMGNEESPGNMGLYDQALAIEWIKANAAAFGGEPESLTLFGESAGAGSVSLHLLSPETRHLASRGILQSGSANTPWSDMSAETARRLAATLANDVGCGDQWEDPAATIECLRSVEASKLSAVQFDHKAKFGSVFGPVVDGVFLPKDPKDLLQEGGFHARNILVGANQDEGTYFSLSDFLQDFDKDNATLLTQDRFLEIIGSIFESSSQLEREAIIFQYTDWDQVISANGSVKNTKTIGDLVGDYLWTCPLNYFGQKFAEDGANVFYYYFTHRSSSNPWGEWMGVLHGDEIEYVFGLPLNPAKDFTESEKKLSRRMMKYFVTFATIGKPVEPYERDDELLESWPKYSRQEPFYVILNGEEREMVGYGPRATACVFWNEFLPSIKSKCPASSGTMSHEGIMLVM